jgi:HPt (histidine-containing phosphotransfer) domain-containing protein
MESEKSIPENFISWEDSVARVGGEEEFLIELLNDLKEMIKENLKKTKSYIREKNYHEIRELAHSMKGASGNLGLNTLYDTTLNLENNAKEENLEKINEYFRNLEQDYINLNILLDN